MAIDLYTVLTAFAVFAAAVAGVMFVTRHKTGGALTRGEIIAAITQADVNVRKLRAEVEGADGTILARPVSISDWRNS